MTRQKRAKLDKKGLSGLGLDKLVDILLEEASANKALKARLQTALAGGTGPQEMARLIDKRLEAVEQATTRINNARAKDLAIEFAGLARNILSELGEADPAGGAERILRFLALRFPLSARLVSDSARLWKVFDDAEGAAGELICALPAEDQVPLAPLLEKLRLRDRYGEHVGFLRTLIVGLAPPAAEAWKALLSVAAPKEPGKFGALDLLQTLAVHQRDADAFIALERAKAENRRDTLAVARMLHEAGRHDEALEWVRMRPNGMRLLPVNGEITSVGPEYGARERRLLEADILERLKRRTEAQELRWREFTETFDAEVLKLYLSKLDDFAEFDELDKALAIVAVASDIMSALEFLIAWPRIDLAARHVIRHADRWDGLHVDVLMPAADSLSETSPEAATILYRTVVTEVLKRGIVTAYEDAVAALAALARIEPRLPPGSGIGAHSAFVANLKKRHTRKFGFWNEVPGPQR